MLRFEQVEWLYLLPVLVLLAFAMLWQQRKLSLKRAALADELLLTRLSGGFSESQKKNRWLLGLAGLACWVVALANPQWGTRTRIAEVQSTEVVIALDISESMLTEDVRPSRLDRAKNFLLDLTNELQGEQLGLILFAGQAYLQMPLTTDYGAAQLLIRSADPAQAPTQGTNFTAAISLARQLLQPEENESTAVRRMLIMVSDGENHETQANSTLQQAVEEGIRLYTVGVGTPEGGRIPARDGTANAYKRGADGGPILSQFNPQTLIDLASEGEGRYLDLSKNSLAVAELIAAEIAEGPSTTVGEEVFLESASYFQLFVFLGLGCWLAAWWWGRTAPTGITSWNEIYTSQRKPKPVSGTKALSNPA